MPSRRKSKEEEWKPGYTHRKGAPGYDLEEKRKRSASRQLMEIKSKYCPCHEKCTLRIIKEFNTLNIPAGKLY